MSALRGAFEETYLDWNSTSPVLPEVASAMAAALPELWGNPSSVHGAGRRARAVLESTREQLAALLGFHPRDVVFTSGGTEANNIALSHSTALVTSRIEHPSVTGVGERLAARGVPVVWADVTQAGQVDVASVERALAGLHSAAGVWVALMAANHETGVVQPVAEVAHCARRYGARLHVDAVQWLGKAPLDVLEHADSVAVAAHKIGGPKGIGALLFRGPAPNPVLLGGAQERGVRPGTQDASSALGFSVALRASATVNREHLAALRDRLEARLAAVSVVNGAGAPRLPHVSNLSFTGHAGPELVAALDLEGVRVSSGSACSAGTPEPSAAILAMLGKERAAGAVRFSLGAETQAQQIDTALAALGRVLGRSL
jgi:cysteine desulfurase